MGQLQGKPHMPWWARGVFEDLPEQVVDQIWSRFDAESHSFGLTKPMFQRIIDPVQAWLGLDEESFLIMCGTIFKKFDTDQNQLVDALELLCALVVCSRMTLQAKLSRVFKAYDYGSNNRLSVDEIVLALHTTATGLSKVVKMTVPHEDRVEELSLQILNCARLESRTIRSKNNSNSTNQGGDLNLHTNDELDCTFTTDLELETNWTTDRKAHKKLNNKERLKRVVFHEFYRGVVSNSVLFSWLAHFTPAEERNREVLCDSNDIQNHKLPQATYAPSPRYPWKRHIVHLEPSRANKPDHPNGPTSSLKLNFAVGYGSTNSNIFCPTLTRNNVCMSQEQEQQVLAALEKRNKQENQGTISDEPPPSQSADKDRLDGGEHDTSLTPFHMVYSVGTVLVVHELTSNRQSLLQQHSAPIVCVSMHSTLPLSATSQVACRSHPVGMTIIWNLESDTQLYRLSTRHPIRLLAFNNATRITDTQHDIQQPQTGYNQNVNESSGKWWNGLGGPHLLVCLAQDPDSLQQQLCVFRFSACTTDAASAVHQGVTALDPIAEFPLACTEQIYCLEFISNTNSFVIAGEGSVLRVYNAINPINTISWIEESSKAGIDTQHKLSTDYDVLDFTCIALANPAPLRMHDEQCSSPAETVRLVTGSKQGSLVAWIGCKEVSRANVPGIQPGEKQEGWRVTEGLLDSDHSSVDELSWEDNYDGNNDQDWSIEAVLPSLETGSLLCITSNGQLSEWTFDQTDCELHCLRLITTNAVFQLSVSERATGILWSWDVPQPVFSTTPFVKYLLITTSFGRVVPFSFDFTPETSSGVNFTTSWPKSLLLEGPANTDCVTMLGFPTLQDSATTEPIVVEPGAERFMVSISRSRRVKVIDKLSWHDILSEVILPLGAECVLGTPNGVVATTYRDEAHDEIWSAIVADTHPGGRCIAIGHTEKKSQVSHLRILYVTLSGTELVIGASVPTDSSVGTVQTVRFSPSGNHVALGGSLGVIQVFAMQEEGGDLSSATVHGSHLLKWDIEVPISHIDFSMNERVVRSNSEEALELCFHSIENSESDAYAQPLKPSKVKDVVWSSETCLFSYDMEDYWNLARNQLSNVPTCRWDPLRCTPTCVNLNRESNTVLLGLDDGSLLLSSYPVDHEVGLTCWKCSPHPNPVSLLSVSVPIAKQNSEEVSTQTHQHVVTKSSGSGGKCVMFFWTLENPGPVGEIGSRLSDVCDPESVLGEAFSARPCEHVVEVPPGCPPLPLPSACSQAACATTNPRVVGSDLPCYFKIKDSDDEEQEDSGDIPLHVPKDDQQNGVRLKRSTTIASALGLKRILHSAWPPQHKSGDTVGLCHSTVFVPTKKKVTNLPSLSTEDASRQQSFKSNDSVHRGNSTAFKYSNSSYHLQGSSLHKTAIHLGIANGSVITATDAVSGAQYTSQLNHNANVTTIAVSPSQRYVASGDYNPQHGRGSIVVSDPGTLKLITKLNLPDKYSGFVPMAIAFSSSHCVTGVPLTFPIKADVSETKVPKRTAVPRRGSSSKRTTSASKHNASSRNSTARKSQVKSAGSRQSSTRPRKTRVSTTDSNARSVPPRNKIIPWLQLQHVSRLCGKGKSGSDTTQIKKPQQRPPTSGSNRPPSNQSARPPSSRKSAVMEQRSNKGMESNHNKGVSRKSTALLENSSLGANRRPTRVVEPGRRGTSVGARDAQESESEEFIDDCLAVYVYNCATSESRVLLYLWRCGDSLGLVSDCQVAVKWPLHTFHFAQPAWLQRDSNQINPFDRRVSTKVSSNRKTSSVAQFTSRNSTAGTAANEQNGSFQQQQQYQTAKEPGENSGSIYLEQESSVLVVSNACGTEQVRWSGTLTHHRIIADIAWPHFMNVLSPLELFTSWLNITPTVSLVGTSTGGLVYIDASNNASIEIVRLVSGSPQGDERPVLQLGWYPFVPPVIKVDPRQETESMQQDESVDEDSAQLESKFEIGPHPKKLLPSSDVPWPRGIVLASVRGSGEVSWWRMEGKVVDAVGSLFKLDSKNDRVTQFHNLSTIGPICTPTDTRIRDDGAIHDHSGSQAGGKAGFQANKLFAGEFHTVPILSETLKSNNYVVSSGSCFTTQKRTIGVVETKRATGGLDTTSLRLLSLPSNIFLPQNVVVSSVASHPVTNDLFVICRSGLVLVYAVSHGVQSAHVAQHSIQLVEKEGECDSATFSPCGKLLAIGMRGTQFALVLADPKHNLVQVFTGGTPQWTNTSTTTPSLLHHHSHVQFAADTSLLAVSSASDTAFYKVELSPVNPNAVSCVALFVASNHAKNTIIAGDFSSDARYFCSRDVTGVVKIVNLVSRLVATGDEDDAEVGTRAVYHQNTWATHSVWMDRSIEGTHMRTEETKSLNDQLHLNVPDTVYESIQDSSGAQLVLCESLGDSCELRVFHSGLVAVQMVSTENEVANSHTSNLVKCDTLVRVSLSEKRVCATDGELRDACFVWCGKQGTYIAVATASSVILLHVQQQGSEYVSTLGTPKVQQTELAEFMTDRVISGISRAICTAGATNSSTEMRNTPYETSMGYLFGASAGLNQKSAQTHPTIKNSIVFAGGSMVCVHDVTTSTQRFIGSPRKPPIVCFAVSPSLSQTDAATGSCSRDLVAICYASTGKRDNIEGKASSLMHQPVVEIYDLSTGELVRELFGTYVGVVHMVTWSPDIRNLCALQTAHDFFDYQERTVDVPGGPCVPPIQDPHVLAIWRTDSSDEFRGRWDECEGGWTNSVTQQSCAKLQVESLPSCLAWIAELWDGQYEVAVGVKSGIQLRGEGNVRVLTGNQVVSCAVDVIRDQLLVGTVGGEVLVLRRGGDAVAILGTSDLMNGLSCPIVGIEVRRSECRGSICKHCSLAWVAKHTVPNAPKPPCFRGSSNQASVHDRLPTPPDVQQQRTDSSVCTCNYVMTTSDFAGRIQFWQLSKKTRGQGKQWAPTGASFIVNDIVGNVQDVPTGPKTDDFEFKLVKQEVGVHALSLGGHNCDLLLVSLTDGKVLQIGVGGLLVKPDIAVNGILLLNGHNNSSSSGGSNSIWAIARGPGAMNIWGKELQPALVATAGDDGYIKVWDVRSHRIVRESLLGNPIRALDWSADGMLIGAGFGREGADIGESGSVSGGFVILNASTLQALFQGRSTTNPVSAVSFSHDGATFALGTISGELYTYNVHKGCIILHHLLQGVPGKSVVAIDYASDSQFLRCVLEAKSGTVEHVPVSRPPSAHSTRSSTTNRSRPKTAESRRSNQSNGGKDASFKSDSESHHDKRRRNKPVPKIETFIFDCINGSIAGQCSDLHPNTLPPGLSSLSWATQRCEAAVMDAVGGVVTCASSTAIDMWIDTSELHTVLQEQHQQRGGTEVTAESTVKESSTGVTLVRVCLHTVATHGKGGVAIGSSIYPVRPGSSGAVSPKLDCGSVSFSKLPSLGLVRGVCVVSGQYKGASVPPEVYQTNSNPDYKKRVIRDSIKASEEELSDSESGGEGLEEGESWDNNEDESECIIQTISDPPSATFYLCTVAQGVFCTYHISVKL